MVRIVDCNYVIWDIMSNYGIRFNYDVIFNCDIWINDYVVFKLNIVFNCNWLIIFELFSMNGGVNGVICCI